VLLDTRANAIARFHARESDPERGIHHREAAVMAGGDDGLGDMYDRLVALLDERPRARVVRITASDIEGAYRSLLTALRDDRPPPRAAETVVPLP
jgi:hypothetical protein